VDVLTPAAYTLVQREEILVGEKRELFQHRRRRRLDLRPTSKRAA
jgi:hypothetical protein